MSQLYVIKHPNPHTLASVSNVDNGGELMSESAFSAWRDAELANGWTPAPLPEPAPSDSEVWAEWLTGTITDPVSGIALKCSIAARDAFVGQVALIREALDAGVLTGADTMSVWDAANVEHILTITDLRALLLRYGIAWQTAFNQLAP